MDVNGTFVGDFIAPLIFPNETNVGVYVWQLCKKNIACTASVDVCLSLYIFLALALLCDDYLVPAIEVLCQRLSIPDEAAGASFVAFATSAPEIMVNAAATRRGKVEMSMSCIMGSAIIGFALIPGCCALVVPPGDGIHLSTPIVFRDTLAFMIAVTTAIIVMDDGKLTVLECSLLVIEFFLYMLAIYIPFCYKARITDSDLEPQSADSPRPADDLVHYRAQRSPASADVDTLWLESGAEDDEDPRSALMGGKSASGSLHKDQETLLLQHLERDWEEMDMIDKATHVLALPLKFAFRWVVEFIVSQSIYTNFKLWQPDFYALAFLMAMLWTTVLSELSLSICEEMAENFAVRRELMGVTVVALGTSVPDTIASIVLTQHGMGGGAICNAVGSQVINITLGIGLPFILYDLITGKSILIQTGHIHVVSIALVISIAIYLLCLFMCSANPGKGAGDGNGDSEGRPDFSTSGSLNADTRAGADGEQSARQESGSAAKAKTDTPWQNLLGTPQLTVGGGYVLLATYALCNVVFVIVHSKKAD